MDNVSVRVLSLGLDDHRHTINVGVIRPFRPYAALARPVLPIRYLAEIIVARGDEIAVHNPQLRLKVVSLVLVDELLGGCLGVQSAEQKHHEDHFHHRVLSRLVSFDNKNAQLVGIIPECQIRPGCYPNLGYSA